MKAVTTRERVRCIVMEAGSAHACPLPAEMFDETVMIAQSLDESPLAFAYRVLSRLASMSRVKRQFQTISLLTGEGHDAACDARRRIVLGFAAQVRALGQPAALVVGSRPSATAAQRHELLQLAGEVLATASSLQVSVRFARPPGGNPDAEALCS